MTFTDGVILVIVILIVGLILYFNIRNYIKNKGACSSCSKKNRCFATDKDYFNKIKENIKNDGK